MIAAICITITAMSTTTGVTSGTTTGITITANRLRSSSADEGVLEGAHPFSLRWGSGR